MGYVAVVLSGDNGADAPRWERSCWYAGGERRGGRLRREG